MTNITVLQSQKQRARRAIATAGRLCERALHVLDRASTAEQRMAAERDAAHWADDASCWAGRLHEIQRALNAATA